MIKVLFICHGNICRSPMAEFVLKDMVAKNGIADKYHIESAAVSSEEIGNPVYPPARRKLNELGIDCSGKRARKITREDYARFDLILAADASNVRNMLRFWGGDPDNKIHLLLEYTENPRDISDPWYTGDFDLALADIMAGCTGILRKLEG